VDYEFHQQTQNSRFRGRVNFFLDTEEKVCLIDFDGVALLSESFANLTLKRRDSFVEKVADCMNWPTHDVKSMGRAIGLLQMITKKTLGTFICARDRILTTIRDRSQRGRLSQGTEIGPSCYANFRFP
jgi:hypothetical protein